MKYTSTCLALIALLASPFFTKAQGFGFSVNGRVGQLSSPAKAYLRYSKEAGQQTDSTIITNGKFTFKGNIDEPISAYLFINKKGDGISNVVAGDVIELYLEQSPVTVTSPDSLGNAKITGGPVNADNNRLTTALQPYQEKLYSLSRDRRALSPEQATKEVLADYTERTAVIRKQMDAVMENFIKSNPSSMVSLYTLKRYATPFPDLSIIVPLFNQLSPAIRATPSGARYAEVLDKLKTLSIGAPAPDFSESDTSGKVVSLHDFRGSYVLVDFWASWCGPCRRENPNVVAAYAKYKSKGFEVLGVSLDKPGAKASWLKAIHDDKLTWTQVSDFNYFKNAAAVLYAVQAIPQNFLIDRDGKIIAKNLRGAALNDQLAKLFDSQ